MRLFTVIIFSISICGCKVTEQSNVDSKFLSDQIQLDLADKMKPSRISAGFQSLGLSYLCTLDKTKNVCVFSFDAKKKSLDEILDFMGREVGVEGAQKTKGCH